MHKHDTLTIHLKDISTPLIYAWRDAFKHDSHVHVSQGNILDEDADAIVSPANSFGFMDGGLDLLYSQHFGWELETTLRERLLTDFDGELPVGEAVIVPTHHPRVPFLVSAPTMRVPMRVDGQVNAYLAFRGALRAVLAHNRTHTTPIKKLLCPGLATGEGGMSPQRCARQMRHAYDVVILGHTLRKGGLAQAVHQHIWLLD